MEEKKKGFFSRLVEGLNKTRENIVSGMDSIFSGFSAIDEDFYEELEETLIMGDLGIQTTMSVLDDLRKKVKEQHIKEPAECKQLLIDSIREQMNLGENAYEFENRKSVVLVIGVNGVGKTTSVGKLAGQLKDEGKKVILAAADTFRAAAIEQLTEWANRAGVEIIAQQEGSDPAAVIYDAVAAAKSRQADVLICDTAGRLHNKKNLMEELKKDQPHHRQGIPGCIPRDAGRAGRNYRTECHGPGKAVYGGCGHHRHHPDQIGRYSEGRHCSCDPVRTGHPGKIRGSGREDRRSPEVQFPGFCDSTV